MSRVIHNFQRALKRLDRVLSGPIVEFSEQFLYGHREILIAYAGLDAKAMIKGSIEHGWALDSGRGIKKLTGGRYLYLSWSKSRIARSGINEETTVAIGAPFIYAMEMVSADLNQHALNQKDNKTRILFFPVHGNEFSQQNPISQIALFREKYDPTSSTVCLYWVEYINPEIYRLYEQAGFNIVCAGFSGQMEHTGLGYSARRLAGSPIGGRPNFILHTIAMLANYNLVVFGGLGTATFYAAYMNKKIDLLHEYLNTTFLDMDSEHGTIFEAHPLEASYVKYIADTMGCRFAEIDYNSQKFRQFAYLELGRDSMRSPQELKKIFSKFLDFSANPQSLGVFQESVSRFDSILTSYA